MEKIFRRGATPKGQLINAKLVETRMLQERIDKMTEVQNLLMDQLHICNSSRGLAPVALQEASLCPHCSRIDHVKLHFPVMAIQGQSMYRQGGQGGPNQQGRPNYLGAYPNYYNNHIFHNNP